MVAFYVMKIKDGTITIKDVPVKWRDKVKAEYKTEQSWNWLE